VQGARFFKRGADFRKWLERHHRVRPELLLGFFSTKSGRGGLTYRQALDEALCFGWIDGRRTNLDAVSYTIRFTPRTAKSHWSRVNITRALELRTAGLMAPAGLEAFERRDEGRTIDYSYELNAAALGPAAEKAFRANRKAWTFFESQAPSYQRVAKFWVTSAKREETREKRLAVLIADSARGRRLRITRSDKKVAET
jgi:uncharacterized protein YdeI (YjbR/CyaY-like superfamily)